MFFSFLQLIAEHNRMTTSFKTTERDMNKDILEYLLVNLCDKVCFYLRCTTNNLKLKKIAG